MKKFFEIIFLIAFIATAFTYIILSVSFNLTREDNPVNILLRKKVIPYGWARYILRLSQPGDARFDYGTSGEFRQMDIAVYRQDGVSLDPSAMDIVIREIKRVVDKPEGITLGNPELIDESWDTVSDADLLSLTRKYSPKLYFTGKSVPLSIMVLKKYAPHPTYAGLVTDANSIFIFKDAITDVSDRQVSDRDAEVSTILHEFGHLLGADHVPGNGCILSEQVENTTFFNLPSVITDSYCDTDIDEIRMALTP
jgi:hypothetical protein